MNKLNKFDNSESLLKLIQQKGEAQKINISDSITIKMGREKVYTGVIGEAPTKDKLTPENLDKISQAISDPKKSKGTVSVKIGTETVFRVQDGKVTDDKLGLTPPQAPTQKAVQKTQKTVQKAKPSTSDLQKQIDDLQTYSKLQQKIIEEIQKQNQQSLPKPKNNRLQNFFNQVETQVKQVSKKLGERAKEDIKKVDEALKSIMPQPPKVDNAKAKQFENDARRFVKIFGKTQPDGSRTFTTSSFDFEQRENDITVKAKNGDVVLKNDQLSPKVARWQLESLEKIKPVVDNYVRIQQSSKQQAQASRGGR